MFARLVSKTKAHAKAETRNDGPLATNKQSPSREAVGPDEQPGKLQLPPTRSRSFVDIPISPPEKPSPQKNIPRPVERLLGSRGKEFGTGDVHIHTGEAAAASAESMQARAYTYGQDIVFNRGEFDPSTAVGRDLLDHELGHIERQSSPSLYRLAFQKQPAAPPKFYQEVSDAVSSVSRSAIPNPELPYLEDLLSLSEAVESQNKSEVKRLAAKVVTYKPASGQPFARTDKYVNELVTRTLLMGLESEAITLRNFFRALAASPGRREPTDEKFGADKSLWQQLAARAINEAKFSNAAEASASIDSLLTTFRLISNEVKRINFSDVLKERKNRPADFSDVFSHSNDNIDAYFNTLIGSLIQLTVPIFHGVETMMEAAIKDLEADKGNTALDSVKAAINGKIAPAFSVTLGDQNLLDIVVNATRSTFGEHEGKHLDYFDTSKAGEKRSVTINYFDKNQTTGFNEKTNPVGYILLTLRKEIDFLEKFYVKGNRAAMGTSALKLESVDDWRSFLHNKVLELQKAGKKNDEVLTTVIKFLSDYLETFTTSTPFNIEDVIKQESENYNKRQLPRAITGQLIEDCGVYALRTVYMLSLVKFDLKLRIRFIFLPVHVGLIITGDGLPTLIAHNNKIYPIDDATLAKERKDWAAKDPSKPTGDDQFIGEVAASYFTPGVDVPFRLEEAPNIPKGDLQEKEKLQKYYESTLTRNVLADAPKAGITQFHLEYLRLNDEAKKMFNNVVVPAWNTAARKVWQDHKDKLFAQLALAREGKKNTYDSESKAYLTDLDAALKPIDDAASVLNKSRQDVSKTLGANPDLTPPTATRGFGSRVSFTFFWQTQLAEHQKAVADQSDLKNPAKPVAITPPFSDPKGFLQPIF